MQNGGISIAVLRVKSVTYTVYKLTRTTREAEVYKKSYDPGYHETTHVPGSYYVMYDLQQVVVQNRYRIPGGQKWVFGAYPALEGKLTCNYSILVDS